MAENPELGLGAKKKNISTSADDHGLGESRLK